MGRIGFNPTVARFFELPAHRHSAVVVSRAEFDSYINLLISTGQNENGKSDPGGICDRTRTARWFVSAISPPRRRVYRRHNDAALIVVLPMFEE